MVRGANFELEEVQPQTFTDDIRKIKRVLTVLSNDPWGGGLTAASVVTSCGRSQSVQRGGVVCRPA